MWKKMKFQFYFYNINKSLWDHNITGRTMVY